MKIELKQDWKSMIEHTDTAVLDIEATKRAYESALQDCVEREFPGAEVDVDVSDEHFRLGTRVDGGEPDADTQQRLEDCADHIWSIGDFWVNRWRIDRAYQKVYRLAEGGQEYELFATFTALGVEPDDSEHVIEAAAKKLYDEIKLWRREQAAYDEWLYEKIDAEERRRDGE